MQRLTRTVTRTLLAFLEAPRSRRYGYDLMKVADISSGTLYRSSRDSPKTAGSSHDGKNRTQARHALALSCAPSGHCCDRDLEARLNHD